MQFILFLLLGIVVGTLARFVVPGREPGGLSTSLLLGVGGSLLGGFAGQVVGLYPAGQPAGFLMSLLVAISLVATHREITRGHRVSRSE